MQEVRLSISGAEIIPKRAHFFSYKEEMGVAAAGPAFSLLLALISAYGARYWESEELFLFSGLNLIAALFNMIPAGPLDGGRMLKALLIQCCKSCSGERVYDYISTAFSVALVSVSFFYVVRMGGNLTLLLTAVWLFLSVRKQHG